MKRSLRISSLLLVALVALAALTIAAPVLATGGTKIVLSPAKAFPGAKGAAEYQAQPGQRDLQVEVEHIRALKGRQVVFYVGGARIGSARVNRFGKADLSRNTELGQRVPQISAGTKVMVRTSRATTIVSGSF